MEQFYYTKNHLERQFKIFTTPYLETRIICTHLKKIFAIHCEQTSSMGWCPEETEIFQSILLLFSTTAYESEQITWEQWHKFIIIIFGSITWSLIYIKNAGVDQPVWFAVMFSFIQNLLRDIRLLVKKSPFEDSTEVPSTLINRRIVESVPVNSIDCWNSHDSPTTNRIFLEQSWQF